ncbi:MAG: GNAT family N-acetyltransferase [Chloroflexi bacterium]|nr:GNAT family N-acetyltransferase [Chloroflexota bacterium]
MGMIIYQQVNDELELKQAFEVRRKVFIEEQGISGDEEWDGFDDSALQFVAKNGDKVIGTARVRFPSADCAKIERMAVLKSFRKQGIGRGIISNIEELLKQRQIPHVILHAQWSAVPFYQSRGFVKTGKPFFEADIKHIKMRKKIV